MSSVKRRYIIISKRAEKTLPELKIKISRVFIRWASRSTQRGCVSIIKIFENSRCWEKIFYDLLLADVSTYDG